MRTWFSALAFPCAVLTAALGFDGLGGAEAADPQAYPVRPVRIVVPYTPGGATDTVARIVAKGLTERLGQSVLIENRPGASGNIGTDVVARAEPDGYTILFATTANAINEGLGMPLNSRILDDFELITQLVQLQNVLVVRPDFAAQDVAAVVAQAKAEPGKLTYASAGVGTSIHIAGELFKFTAEVDMLHVPFKGSAPALTAVRAGEVEMMFDNLPSALPQIRGGALKALGVSGGSPSALLPDVPTISDAGVPGYEIVAWHGLAAPAGTPPHVIDTLVKNTQAVLADPAVVQQLEQLGAEVADSDPARFRERVAGDIDKFSKVIEASGIKAE